MKKIFYFLSAIICGFGFMQVTEAITTEEFVAIDSNNQITLPSIVVTDGSEVTVDRSLTNYQLFYQWVSISDSEATKLDELKTEMQTIETEMENYINSATEEEKETEEYQNKITEYYNLALAAIEEYASLIPAYNESNWITSTNNIINMDTAAEGRNFLWVKLETSDNQTIYELGEYNLTSDSSEIIEDTEIVKDTNSAIQQINQENTGNNSETIQTTTNPSTGLSDYLIYIVPIIIIVGLVLVFSKKYQKIY